MSGLSDFLPCLDLCDSEETWTSTEEQSLSFQPPLLCFTDTNLRLPQVQTCFASTAPRIACKQSVCPPLDTPRYKSTFLNTCITDNLAIALPASVDSPPQTPQSGCIRVTGLPVTQRADTREDRV